MQRLKIENCCRLSEIHFTLNTSSDRVVISPILTCFKSQGKPEVRIRSGRIGIGIGPSQCKTASFFIVGDSSYARVNFIERCFSSTGFRLTYRGSHARR